MCDVFFFNAQSTTMGKGHHGSSVFTIDRVNVVLVHETNSVENGLHYFFNIEQT